MPWLTKEIRKRHLGENHRLVADSQFNLSWVVTLLGDPRTGEDLVDRALRTRRKLLGEENRDTALAYVCKAFVMVKRGRRVEAFLPFSKALKILGTGEEGKTLGAAVTQFQAGVLFYDSGWYVAAEKQLRDCLETIRRHIGKGHPYEGVVLFHLGLVLEAKGDLAGAEALYREALTLAEQTVGLQHPLLLVLANEMRFLLARRGKSAEAGMILERLLKAQRKELLSESPPIADTLTIYGVFLAEQNKAQEAETNLREASAIYGRYATRTFLAMNNAQALGHLCLQQRRYGEARDYFERTLVLAREVAGEDSSAFAFALSEIGELFFQQRELGRAGDEFLRSLAAFRKLRGLTKEQKKRLAFVQSRLALIREEQRKN